MVWSVCLSRWAGRSPAAESIRGEGLARHTPSVRCERRSTGALSAPDAIFGAMTHLHGRTGVHVTFTALPAAATCPGAECLWDAWVA